GCAFYFLVYVPYEEEAQGLTDSIASLSRDIRTQQTSLENHQFVTTFQEPVSDAFLYMQKFLPKENEMPRLVQMVSEIGAQAGLSDGVTLFEPKLPAVIRDNYAEITFTMNLQGEFLTILSFLYNFSKMDRIVNITKFTIGSPTMVDEQRGILVVSVQCSGSTYRVLTDDEIAAKATAATTSTGTRGRR
ncbi:MAG: type 4a pilus biogenesis protein PilO, partial [Candidatus Adiutrix sp.]